MGWDQSEFGYGLWSLGKGPPQQMRACGGYGPGEGYGPGRAGDLVFSIAEGKDLGAWGKKGFR